MKKIFDNSELAAAFGLRKKDFHHDNKTIKIYLNDFLNTAESEFTEELDDGFIQGFIEIAAVSGGFDPWDFYQDINKKELQSQLNKVSDFFVIDIINGKTNWTLNASLRRNTINDLLYSGRLSNRLSGTLPNTDEIGVDLRNLLGNKLSFNYHELPQQSLLKYALLIEMLQGSDLFMPDLGEIRSLIKKNAFIAQHSIDNNSEFIGRQKEINTLNEFAKTLNHSDESWLSMLVYGVGGAGKTAILQQFYLRTLQTNNSIVINLDFDKPGMDPNDAYWLISEVSRQLSYQFPILDKDLKNLRKKSRNEKRERDLVMKEYRRETNGNSIYLNFLLDMSQILRSLNLLSKNLILILDTYEEVTQRNLHKQMVDFLDDLATNLSDFSLKVIFSGRIFNDGENYPSDLSFTKRLIINEFDKSLTAQFLVSQKIPLKEAEKLSNAKFFPRRPLELKLLAKIFKQEGNKGIKELQMEIGGDSCAAKIMFSGVVYRRVLLRLKSPILQKLAYPGLILRYLTPKMIRDLIVPVLELSPMEVAESEKVFNDLAGYGWLAYKQKDKLYHRKDMRRAMLELMRRDDPQKTHQIHLQAISFFEQEGDSDSEIEVLYHQLMLGQFPASNEEYYFKKLLALEPDASDFPHATQVYFQFVTKGKISLRNLSLLPENQQRKAVSRLANQYVNSSKFRAAFKLYNKYKNPYYSQYYAFGNDNQWIQEVLIAQVEWNVLDVDPVYDSRIRLFRTEVNYLYTITLCRRPADMLITFLEWIVNSELLISQGPQDIEDQPELLSRLTFSLVIITHERTLSSHILNRLRIFIDTLGRVFETKRNIDFYRCVTIIELLLGNQYKPQYLYQAQYAKLDAFWLTERIAEKTNPQEASDLEQIEKFIYDYQQEIYLSTNSKTLPIRNLLSRIDSEQSHFVSEFYTLPLGNDSRLFDFEKIKGPVTALRMPVKYALMDAFHGNRGIEELLSVLGVVMGYFFTESEHEVFIMRFRKNMERELGSYIEFIDRQWNLPKLITQSLVLRPRNEKLRRVGEIANEWYRSYEELWDRYHLN